jgi:ParB family chromosome partitioning protein
MTQSTPQTDSAQPKPRKALPGVPEPEAADTPAPAAAPIERDLALAWNRITPSPLNPRTQFDAEGIDDLADSIESRGLLARLVVRRHPAPALLDGEPDYLLIAGERRYRAIRQLIESGRWPVAAHPDGLIPCVLRDYGDDAEHLVDALVENCQREDVAPLDEARAFAALRDTHGWRTERIAQTIGKTARHVQMRLELVDKLSPAVQEALVQGKLPLAQARELTVAPAAMQDAALKQIEKGDWGFRTGEDTRKTLRAKLIDFDIALFDRGDFDGETSGGGGKLYTADKERFAKFQRGAAEERCAELRGEWAWAELVDTWLTSWKIEQDYVRSDDRSVAGVLVHLDPGSLVVTEHPGLVAKTDADADAEKKAQEKHWAAQREMREKREAAWARLDAGIAAGMAVQPRIALAALVATALANDYELAIETRWPGRQALAFALGPILDRFIQTDEDGDEVLAGDGEIETQAALIGAYRAISDKAIPLDEIVEAAAACLAASVPRYDTRAPSPFLRALAEDLKVAIPAELLPAEPEDAEDGASAAA